MQRERENSESLKRRKKSVTQENSHKDISGFVQRNLADHEEGLITYSTLTQWKAAPREGQERAREKVLPTESQQILGGGKDRPRPPAHQETSKGPGQGLGNLYA